MPSLPPSIFERQGANLYTFKNSNFFPRRAEECEISYDEEGSLDKPNQQRKCDMFLTFLSNATELTFLLTGEKLLGELEPLFIDPDDKRSPEFQRIVPPVEITAANR